MQHYDDKLLEIRKKATSLDPYADIARLTQFTFFSANLTNFLPSLSFGQHIQLFKQAFLNQQLSHLDQSFFGKQLPFAIHGWDDQLPERLRSEPGIICTLHLGSYRLVNYLMATAGIPFAILMSKRAADTQGSGFKQLFKTLRHRHRQAQLDIIDAEDGRALWKLSACLKQGINVLVYLDGYTGLPAQRDQLVEIPFLAQHLLVRKGAAFLANRLEKPLYPILCVRDGDHHIAVKAGKPIGGNAINDPGWPELALTHLFAFFGSVIMHHPAQWENWFFLQQQVAINQMPGSVATPLGKQVPTPDEFGVVCLDECYYLLRKKGYQAFRIDCRLYNLLKTIWQKRMCDG